MLQIRNLVKVYPGPVAALQGIDLEISHGMFGLLGPNGAGKTTLMRIVAGLLEPTSGSVTLDGTDIIGNPEYIWNRLGYLPQEFGFYPHLTGEAMLAYILKLKGFRSGKELKSMVKAHMSRVHLDFASKRKIKTYSGGMRQRLGIAQAIAGNPRIIIVDEPTAGLDPEERLRFYHLLTELAEDRIVLLSTHLVEDVAVLCSRFAVIREGRIVTLTSPGDAKAQIHGTIFEGSVTAEELTGLQKDFCITQSLLMEGKNRIRIYETGQAPPPGFIPVEPTLEDVYLVTMHKNGNHTLNISAKKETIFQPENTQ